MDAQIDLDGIPDGVPVTLDPHETEQHAAGQPEAKPDGLDENSEAWIPESLFEALQDKVAKLNKRAAKLGCPAIGLKITGERFIPVRKFNGVEHVVVGHKREVHVRITGAAPQVAGWAFVARIEHLGEAGNIVSKAPDERATKLDESLWLAKPACEHCKLARHRKDTFILRELATGTVKQVGRNCLADFLRTADVEMALSFWKFLHEITMSIGGGEDEDEGGWGGGGGRRYFDTVQVLHTAASAIRVAGWTSRAKAKEMSDGFGAGGKATADMVDFLLDPPWSRHNERENDEIKKELARFAPVPQDGKTADDTLEWIRRRLDPQSDYERNLKVALTPDYVDPRNIGLVVSAVQAWLRLTSKLEAANRPAKADAGYLGEVGQRLRKIRVRIVDSKVWDNEVTGFTTNLLTFVDEAGHQFKWFASGNRELTIGRDAVLTGTVKKHEEWKGSKSTVLSRCVVEVA